MSLISDAGPHRAIMRILRLPAQVLTCGKQVAQLPRCDADGPRNPGRNRLQRVPAERTCILIKAA